MQSLLGNAFSLQSQGKRKTAHNFEVLQYKTNQHMQVKHIYFYFRGDEMAQ